MRLLKWILIVPLLVLFLVWFGHKKNTSGPQSLPRLLAIPSFQMVDQNNNSFSDKNLLGRVFLINFIFTKCPTVCPILTQTMKDMTQRAKNPAIGFLSISVDPTNDNPQVLKLYGEKFGADFSRWSFLTGSIDEISEVVVKGFKMVLIREVKDLMDITHGEHFVLVDKKGYIRAYRTIQTESDKLSILEDLESLAKE